MTTAADFLVAALMFVMTCLVGVIAWVFLDFRATITRQIQTNGRHLDSLITSLWQLVMRVDHVETYLDDETDFRPIKVPVPPSGE